MAQTVKILPAMQDTRVQSLGWEDALAKGMATPSSILDWRIPWIEESGGPQSTRSQSWTQLRDQHFQGSAESVTCHYQIIFPIFEINSKNKFRNHLDCDDFSLIPSY